MWGAGNGHAPANQPGEGGTNPDLITENEETMTDAEISDDEFKKVVANEEI